MFTMGTTRVKMQIDSFVFEIIACPTRCMTEKIQISQQTLTMLARNSSSYAALCCAFC